MADTWKLGGLAAVAIALGIIVYMLFFNTPPTVEPTTVPIDTHVPNVGGVRAPVEPVALPNDNVDDGSSNVDDVATAGEPKIARIIEPEEFDGRFTESDIDFLPGKVTLELGTYANILAGDEFEVSAYLTAPPMARLVMTINFDPDMLEFVTNSVIPGEAIQHGVEAYGRAGQLIIFNKGKPGSRNTIRVSDEKITDFRMRAKRAGNAALVAECKFVNGRGELLEYEVLGGEVMVVQ